MFRKFVLRVLSSAEGRAIVRRYAQNMVAAEIAEQLENRKSITRLSMMKIIRSEAKDAIEELREHAQEFAELDQAYVRWAQTKRQTLLAEQNATKAALMKAVEDSDYSLENFPEDSGVYVHSDALFWGQTGLVKAVHDLGDFPRVEVRLLGHRETVSFASVQLEPLGEAATTALREAFALMEGHQRPDPAAAATELLPAVDQ